MIPEEKRGIYIGPTAEVRDAAKRREGKIAQFKLEREIKGKLEVSTSLEFSSKKLFANAN